MIERVQYDLNIEAAILFANNQYQNNEQDFSYEESNDEEYIVVTDPIKRIVNTNY